MNIECSDSVLAELNDTFRYNDAIIRNLVIRCKDAITDVSPIKASEGREDRRSAPQREERNNDNSDEVSEESED
jgi:small subunit ribosomal protein S6